MDQDLAAALAANERLALILSASNERLQPEPAPRTLSPTPSPSPDTSPNPRPEQAINERLRAQLAALLQAGPQSEAERRLVVELQAMLPLTRPARLRGVI